MYRNTMRKNKIINNKKEIIMFYFLVIIWLVCAVFKEMTGHNGFK